MMRLLPFIYPAASVVCAAVVICTACHAATRPAPAAAPVRPAEGYCWWAVFRSPLRVDTVVARYARAYARVGLSGVAWSHAGDTAWAHAGPTVLGGAHANGTYAARIVAYQHGDSTHFRTYVLLIPPAGGWPGSDSAVVRGDNVGAGRQIGFCAELGRAAGAEGTAPGWTDGEEKLGLWQRY